jgi:hypothetical protein
LDVNAHVATFFTLDFYDHPTQVRSNLLLPVAATAMSKIGEQVVHASHTLQERHVLCRVILSQLQSLHLSGCARSHVYVPCRRNEAPQPQGMYSFFRLARCSSVHGLTTTQAFSTSCRWMPRSFATWPPQCCVWS